MINELEIILKKIPADGLLFFSEINPTLINLDYPLFSFEDNIKLNLKINIVDKEILVSGSLNTIVKCFCDRCLEPLDFELNVNKMLIDYENINQDSIDLTPEIRDEILLTLPKKILCKDDCKGLCFICKNNLNNNSCKCNERLKKNNPFISL